MIITTILPMLSPASAAARLLALAHSIDMSGIHTVTLPYIGKSGRPVPLFIAEGAPIPFAELTTNAVTLGPTKRVEVLTGLTNELLQASGDTARNLVRRRARHCGQAKSGDPDVQQRGWRCDQASRPALRSHADCFIGHRRAGRHGRQCGSFSKSDRGERHQHCQHDHRDDLRTGGESARARTQSKVFRSGVCIVRDCRRHGDRHRARRCCSWFQRRDDD